MNDQAQYFQPKTITVEGKEGERRHAGLVDINI
jgi:hypothetical protein